MASIFDGCDWQQCKWKVLVLLCAFQTAFHQAESGSCGKDETSGTRHKKGDDNCWYELWYFWFILVLAFLTIVVLVIFYCKQQVKRSSSRRGRRRTPVMSMAMAPPQYETPGHQPPPYHIAMSTTVPADQSIPPSAGQRCGHPCTIPYTATCHQAANLPGCVAEPQELHVYDNISMASTLSIGAISNPPPYSSRPTSGIRRQRQDHNDVAL
ncbi:uncharacterized protein [Littorina saxatilis]|uniref:Uncharacterized protein n=1 Tax=Littorina saxatilis TaxID=31220 RepID=A0AAN9BNS2_9CAEN